MVEAEDYKCWPSYSHLGCLLSIHSPEEAAAICNSQSQCQSFILTQQRTWTGELGQRSGDRGLKLPCHMVPQHPWLCVEITPSLCCVSANEKGGIIFSFFRLFPLQVLHRTAMCC